MNFHGKTYEISNERGILHDMSHLTHALKRLKSDEDKAIEELKTVLEDLKKINAQIRGIINNTRTHHRSIIDDLSIQRIIGFLTQLSEIIASLERLKIDKIEEDVKRIVENIRQCSLRIERAPPFHQFENHLETLALQ